MNKRQRKKRGKSIYLIIADEANLLTMTPEELEKAFADYKKFREKYAYRKKYKDLKEGKALRYFYPIGKIFVDDFKMISQVTSSAWSKNSNFVTATQSLNDFNS